MSKFKRKNVIIKQRFIARIITAMVQAASFAQLPEQAEDLSPLLYGEIIPEGILTVPNDKDRHVSVIIEEKPTILLVYPVNH